MKKTSISLLLTLALAFVCGTAQAKTEKLRILTSNVRLLTKADGPLNLWQDRRDPLCAYIKQVAPDIFGMQEVTKPQLDDAQKRLPGYSYVGVGRDDGHEKGEYSPVWYRSDKFNLIDKGWFWLSETPDVPSFGWHAACRRIASWAVLEDKKTKARFFFCNTHFDHISVQARMESAKLCKDKSSSSSRSAVFMYWLLTQSSFFWSKAAGDLDRRAGSNCLMNSRFEKISLSPTGDQPSRIIKLSIASGRYPRSRYCSINCSTDSSRLESFLPVSLLIISAM